MSDFSVVIPSRNATNLAACVGAIRAAGETCRIIVVDDGVQWGTSTPFLNFGQSEVIAGVKPFCFARNVNLGVQAAGKDDVVILNDDSLLETERLLAWGEVVQGKNIKEAQMILNHKAAIEFLIEIAENKLYDSFKHGKGTFYFIKKNEIIN